MKQIEFDKVKQYLENGYSQFISKDFLTHFSTEEGIVKRLNLETKMGTVYSKLPTGFYIGLIREKK